MGVDVTTFSVEIHQKLRVFQRCFIGFYDIIHLVDNQAFDDGDESI